jgi:hypothetical protein
MGGGPWSVGRVYIRFWVKKDLKVFFLRNEWERDSDSLFVFTFFEERMWGSRKIGRVEGWRCVMRVFRILAASALQKWSQSSLISFYHILCLDLIFHNLLCVSVS